MTITAAVDGSALGNPGPAGWAWVVSPQCWAAGGWPHGTNNLGELTAVLELLLATESAGLAGEELHILADSQYAINVITKWRHGWKKRGWKKADKQPIKNLELIQEIDQAISGRAVTFEWVKGHAGHDLNELADDFARGCAEAYRDGAEPKTGPGFAEAAVGEAAVDAGASEALPSTSDAAPQTSARPLSAADGSASTPDQALRSSEEPMAGVARIRAAHLEFLNAWLAGDVEALADLAAPNCHRVWPDGRVTDSLDGPAPVSPSVGCIDIRPVGGTSARAFVACHLLRWEAGASFDTGIWELDADDTPHLVLHQSTLLH